MTVVLACWLASCSGDERPAFLVDGERMPGGMHVSSTAFEAGQPIPEIHSCEGENLPPPLAWRGVPESAEELALVIEDPDAPDETFVHWLVVGIDPATSALTGPEPPAGADVLPGSSDNPTYIGPCPPDNDGDHRYYFQVYALPERLELDERAPPLENVRTVREAAVAGGYVEGTFARP